ncbi:MAG: diaminopimelate epimerase [Marinilabiliales bacterium]|nr:MAG: diaminopimelate epimerase [Marinilabiliales bacterium]
MELKFSKYHGNGNDFIIIDNRSGRFPTEDEVLISRLCNRYFGIGGDGLILLEVREDYDFHMRYFNSDGREATMCGNGGRCLVHFANRLGLTGQDAHFSGIDGPHHARIGENELVHLRMQDVSGIEKVGNAFVLNTGSPHYVVFVADPDNCDVVAEGRKIRYSGNFGERGINVNFVGYDNNAIRVRTYERGVENETLSCGTGSVAAAICSRLDSDLPDHTVEVRSPGGSLEVSFRRKDRLSFTDIWLTGPAKQVFDGRTDTGHLPSL